MKAGALRQRITLQAMTPTQDPVTGEITTAWADFAADVPAEVVPLSGREFIAAAATQAEVSARVTIRYLAGVLPSMRMLFDGQTYAIAAVLPDPTARKHLTLMVSRGVSDGQ